MASSSNVKTRNLGGGLRLTAGQWTAAVGDTRLTVTVQGGTVYGAQFTSNDGSPVFVADHTWAAGTAAGTVTITVNHIGNVTSGYFFIVHA